MESVIQKIQKLLKLAEKTTFPAEAANATAKAQALMDKHKITLGSIDSVEKESPQIFKDSALNEEDSTRRLARWKWSLASSLNRHNGVWAYSSGGQIICVGTPSNVSAVRYLYAYCINQIESLTRASCKGQGAIYANNFRLGCVDAIAEALRKEREQTLRRAREEAADSRELIVVNNAIAAMQKEQREAENYARGQMKFTSSGSRGGRSDSNARSAGKQAGAAIYGGQRGRLVSSRNRLN